MRAGRAKAAYLQAERAEGDEYVPYRDDDVDEVEECRTPPPCKTRSPSLSFRGKEYLTPEFHDDRVESANCSGDDAKLRESEYVGRMKEDVDSAGFENEGDSVKVR